MSTEVVLPNGTVLVGVHPLSMCEGRTCVFHSPTDHHMSDWPMVWRNDTGLLERTCEHGIGHIDPDQFAYLEEVGLMPWASMHGCDGCCHE